MRIAALLLIAAAAVSAAELKPYEIVWRADASVLVDVSFLLDAPAGKAGFVQVRNGHLATADGRRLRLWGVNSSFTASMPAKDQAAALAAHLARFGINCVRVHHLDWRVPRGIIDSRYPDSQHLDPDGLDRLDYYIAELKKHGIYVNLNLNVARSFQAGDKVKDAEQLGFAKAVTYFDPRIVELEKDYARQLLTHKNPYTGNEYRNEPAVAVVEIVNENSLFESWRAGRLEGKGPGKDQDQTWADIPASYASELTGMYNEWLPRQLDKSDLERLYKEAGNPAARLRSTEFKDASTFRFETEAAFYMDLENRFFERMYSYLNQDLKVHAVVVGTSAHNGGLTPYPLMTSTSRLDMVDAHTYWQHPRYLSDPATGKRTGFEIPNTPAVNDPKHSPLVTLSRVAVAGKPFMVSEVNHPYPNEYAAEGIPLLAAYGALQDWDGVFWYSFSHSPAESWSKPALPGHFDMRQDPVKMTQWAAAALLFLRGDVDAARRTVTRSYSREQVLESLRLPHSEQPYFTSGFPLLLPLVHAVRISSLAGTPYEAPADSSESMPGVSDTGQLRWSLENGGKGLVTVNAPRWQAVIGYTGMKSSQLQNLSVKITNDFSAILLASLDHQPISNAMRLLLSTGARVANQGMIWNEKRTSVTDEGKPGMLIEPVSGTITLNGLAKAASVEVIPLDGAGRAGGPAIQASKTGSDWCFDIGETTTPWYLIRVSR